MGLGVVKEFVSVEKVLGRGKYFSFMLLRCLGSVLGSAAILRYREHIIISLSRIFVIGVSWMEENLSILGFF